MAKTLFSWGGNAKCPWDEFNSANQLRVNPRVEAVSIVGSVVECSPATRAARVRFPDDATVFFFYLRHQLHFVWDWWTRTKSYFLIFPSVDCYISDKLLSFFNTYLQAGLHISGLSTIGLNER